MLRHGVFRCIIQVISWYKQKYAVAVTEVWSQGHWRTEGQIKWIPISKVGAFFEKKTAGQFHVHGFSQLQRWSLLGEMLWRNYFWCVHIQVSSPGSSKQRSPSSWSALSIASHYTSPTRLLVFTRQLSNWFPCAWPGTKDLGGISIDQDTLRIHAPIDILRCVFPQFSCDYVKQSHLFPTQLHDVFPTALRIFFADFETTHSRLKGSVSPRSALPRCYSCAEIWWARVKNRPGRDHRTGVFVFLAVLEGLASKPMRVKLEFEKCWQFEIL